MRLFVVTQGGSKSGGESSGSGSALNTISSKTEAQYEPESESPMSKKVSPSSDYQAFDGSNASGCHTQTQNQAAAKFSHVKVLQSIKATVNFPQLISQFSLSSHIPKKPGKKLASSIHSLRHCFHLPLSPQIPTHLRKSKGNRASLISE